MVQQFAERPPHVAFEVRAEEFVSESGERQFRDVDFAIITPHGGNLVVEREARVWLQGQREQGSPFFDHFRKLFDAWKEGQEPPVSGTPLAMVPCFTPAEVKMLQAAGCRSAEDVAAFPDGSLGRIGMGGVGLKKKALAFIEAQGSTGRVAEQLAALRTRLEALESDNKELRDLNKQLKGELDADRPSRRAKAA